MYKDDINFQDKNKGICSECRKASYCKKQCSANKRYMELKITQSLMNANGGLLGKVFSTVYDNRDYLYKNTI